MNVRKDGLSDEEFDIECTTCQKHKSKNKALRFCVNCQEYMCFQCIGWHNSFAQLTGHTFENADSVSAFNISLPPIILTEQCLRHPMELIKMYCGVHDQVACTICISLNHKNCDDVHYIPDVANALYKQHMNVDTTVELGKALNQITTLKETLNNAIKSLSTAKQATLQTIATFRVEVNQMLDKLEKNTRYELESQCETLRGQWQELFQEVTTLMQNLQRCTDQLNCPDHSMLQQFVLTKISKENIIVAHNVCSQLHPTSIQIQFSYNQALKGCLEQLTSLGNVSHVITKQKVGLYKVTDIQTHNVKIPNDSAKCWISGLCVLQSGAFLLADNANKTLKLFDVTRNAVTSYYKLPSYPCAVCSVTDKEAAVSLNNRTIQFFSTVDTLFPTRVLQMDHNCCGLAIVGTDMVVSYRNNLYIHALNGLLLGTINNESLDRQLFTHISRVIAGDNEEIHVADFNNGLITLRKRRVVNKYSRSDLKGARDVCIDCFGHVFVCGRTSNNVLQLGQDGRKLGVVATQAHGLNSPVSICFDNKNFRLIIANADENNILVLTLQ